jgi:hypothetical protein
MLVAAIVQTDLGGVLRSIGTDDRYTVGPPKYLSSICPRQTYFMTHPLFFYREIRRLENLTDFDRVTGFGWATLHQHHEFHGTSPCQ